MLFKHDMDYVAKNAKVTSSMQQTYYQQSN